MATTSVKLNGLRVRVVPDSRVPGDVGCRYCVFDEGLFDGRRCPRQSEERDQGIPTCLDGKHHYELPS